MIKSTDPHDQTTTMHAFMSDLKDSDPTRRANAAEALGNIGLTDPDEALPSLVLALRDEDSMVRANAARALGRIGLTDSDEAIPSLVLALRDKDNTVRANAAEALGYFGRMDPDEVIPYLVLALRDEDSMVRAYAAEALGKIGLTDPDEIIPKLVLTLRDEDCVVRENAARALGQIGRATHEAVPNLVLALSDEDCWVRSGAAQALGQIGRSALESVSKLVLASKDEDWRVRACAVLALGQIDPATLEAVPVLGLALRDEDEWVRYNGFLAVGKYGARFDPQSIPDLVNALRDDVMMVRYNSVLALGKLGPAAHEAVPNLVLTLRDEDEWVRLNATETLGRIGPAAKNAVPILITERRLLQVSEKGLRQLLRQIANDPHWEKTDPELWQAAPYFWTSLVYVDDIPQLIELRFTQRMVHGALGTGGRSVDDFDDAFQELTLQLMDKTTRQLVNQPEKYPTLPKIMEYLVSAAVRALSYGAASSRGKGRQVPSSQSDFSGHLFVSGTSVTAPIEVNDLATKLLEHVSRLKGLKQRLAIEHVLKGVSERKLGDVFGRPWRGLARPLKQVEDDLLNVLQLPNRNALRALAEYVFFSRLKGVVPDVIAQQEE